MALNISLVTKPVFEPVSLAQAKVSCRVDPDFTDDDWLFGIYISAARRRVEKITHRAVFNQTWQRTLDNFPLAASFDYSPSPADKWNWPVYGGMWNQLTIDLPMGRALAINSISYKGVDGAPVVLDPSLYAADLTGIPCRLTPSESAVGGMVWPWQGSYLPGSVAIEWQAGNFVEAVSESFTVPSSSPYIYALLQKSVTGVASMVNGAGDPVSGWTADAYCLDKPTTVTLPSSVAGQTLTVSYYIADTPEDVIAAMLLLIGHYYRNPEATTDLEMRNLPEGINSLLGDHVVEWTDYRPC
jgi:hypothetical protein